MNFKDIEKMYREYTKITTEKEAIEAVKKDGCALQYVKIVKNEVKEITMKEIEKQLGFKFKIIRGE